MSKLDMAKWQDLSVKASMVVIELKILLYWCLQTPNKFIPNAHVEIIREIDGTDKWNQKDLMGGLDTGKQVSKYFEDNIMASYAP